MALTAAGRRQGLQSAPAHTSPYCSAYAGLPVCSSSEKAKRSNSSTRTGRGARSTSTPLRANWYSRWPLTETAEYMGGICKISPRNAGSAFFEFFSGYFFFRTRHRSAGPVAGIHAPRPTKRTPRTPFRYRPKTESLWCRCPTKWASTPVAMGSSVPVCPALRSPHNRRIRATASNDVNPSGLSSTSTPFMRGASSVSVTACTISRRARAGGFFAASSMERAARRCCCAHHRQTGRTKRRHPTGHWCAGIL